MAGDPLDWTTFEYVREANHEDHVIPYRYHRLCRERTVAGAGRRLRWRIRYRAGRHHGGNGRDRIHRLISDGIVGHGQHHGLDDGQHHRQYLVRDERHEQWLDGFGCGRKRHWHERWRHERNDALFAEFQQRHRHDKCDGQHGFQ